MKIKIKSHHFFIYLANNHAPLDIPKYKRIKTVYNRLQGIIISVRPC